MIPENFQFFVTRTEGNDFIQVTALCKDCLMQMPLPQQPFDQQQMFMQHRCYQKVISVPK